MSERVFDLPGEMTLSAAVEKCLRSGSYQRNSRYMCHALTDIYQSQHINSVMALVHSISGDCVSMFTALDKAGYLTRQSLGLEDPDFKPPHIAKQCDDFENLRNTLVIEYVFQLYCWWVFDLKRKGL